MPLSPEDWTFLGEGNMHVVLSHRPRDARNECAAWRGKVLRLRKEPPESTVATAVPTSPLAYTDEGALLVERVVARLLGEHYASRMTVVCGLDARAWTGHMSRSAFARDRQLLSAYSGTNKRLMEAVVEPHYHVDGDDTADTADITVATRATLHAMLMDDHTRFGQGRGVDDNATVTVELKPKWGFVRRGEREATHDTAKSVAKGVKSRRCRYCMHQHHKLATGKITHRSAYCPLDLYSGEVHRVRAALRALVQHPQNNLKLFRGGVAIPVAAGSADVANDIVEAVTDVLIVEPLLTRLAHHQCALDPHDIEFVYAVYQTLSAEERARLEAELRHPCAWSDALDVYLGADASPKAADTLDGDDEDLRYPRKRQLFIEFLLSAALKDCSVMITLAPVDCPISNGQGGARASILCQVDGSLPTIFTNGQYYAYKVKVVDVDPKLFTNIPKYYELDKRIVDCYCESNEALASCTGSTK